MYNVQCTVKHLGLSRTHLPGLFVLMRAPPWTLALGATVPAWPAGQPALSFFSPLSVCNVIAGLVCVMDVGGARRAKTCCGLHPTCSRSTGLSKLLHARYYLILCISRPTGLCPSAGVRLRVAGAGSCR
ncbi:hypothetical protein C8T65DRAFT_148935 [Cerioporus squamosus]|nr:hypothetical protein C8T65DRAFT_148935 [Cerioporus squamosus]